MLELQIRTRMSGFVTSCCRLCYIPLKSAVDADAVDADADAAAAAPADDACRNIVLNFIELCL